MVATTPAHVHVRYRSSAYDLGNVSALLGVDAPEVARQSSPAMWVGDRLHHEASAWLELRHARLRNDKTLSTNAQRLQGWIRFLRSRGQTVHTASEEDYRAYEVACRFPTKEAHPDLIAVSDGWWRNTKSVIKQFHEWLQTTYGTPTPFEVIDKHGPNGRMTRGIADAGRLRQARPGALPLLPAAIDAVVAAAAAPTATGRERGQGLRDQALIQWLVATGMRITPATHLTHYEVPPISGGDFDWLHTPAAVNKYRRAVRSGAFAARLVPTRRYIAGDRAILAAHGTRHAPLDPLHIHGADHRWVTYSDADGVKTRRQWNEMEEGQRHLLVDVNDSSPLLWLTQTGEPMSTRTGQHVVKEAIKRAAAKDLSIPSDASPHSLRHTYATFMAVMWIAAEPDLYSAGEHRIKFGLTDAVRHVQRALGHTDERTTTIYTGHVTDLLGLDPDRLKGKR
ncbi:MAG: hypothetical protein ACR2HR_04400 [Euzebya sp.]